MLSAAKDKIMVTKRGLPKPKSSESLFTTHWHMHMLWMMGQYMYMMGQCNTVITAHSCNPTGSQMSSTWNFLCQHVTCQDISPQRSWDTHCGISWGVLRKGNGSFGGPCTQRGQCKIYRGHHTMTMDT